MGHVFERVVLENYKGHKHTEIALERFTVFVGPNGSGKTSVLEALDALQAYNHKRHFRIEGSKAHRRGSRAGAIEAASSSRASRISWSKDKSGDWPLESSPRHEEWPSSQLLHLDPTALSRSDHTGQLGKPVDSRGSGVSARIALMQLRNPQTVQQASDELSGILRRSGRIYVDADGEQNMLFGVDQLGVGKVSAPLLSEGTRLLVALLTALHDDERPSVLLLENIEQGLHPSGQTRLTQWLAQLVTQTPDLQIIATTHSPFVLDALRPEQVRVFALTKDEAPYVVVKSLAEHPDAGGVGGITTGQLWTLDDEAHWVLPKEDAEPLARAQ